MRSPFRGSFMLQVLQRHALLSTCTQVTGYDGLAVCEALDTNADSSLASSGTTLLVMRDALAQPGKCCI
jgi:hypothetical protein